MDSTVFIYLIVIVLLLLVNWLAIFGRLSVYFFLSLGFSAINIEIGFWNKLIGVIFTLLIAYYLTNANEKVKNNSTHTPLANIGGASLSAYFWGCFLGFGYLLFIYLFF